MLYGVFERMRYTYACFQPTNAHKRKEYRYHSLVERIAYKKRLTNPPIVLPLRPRRCPRVCHSLPHVELFTGLAERYD